MPDGIIWGPMPCLLASRAPRRRMPGISGPELVGVLRTRAGTRDVPVILLTASSGERELAQLRELPVSGVLRKPFDPLTLPDVIAALLGWAPR